MDGIIIGFIVIFIAMIAYGVDYYLYSKDKPPILWRIIPTTIYIVALIYLYFRFGFNTFWVRNMWVLTLFLVSVSEDIRKKELPIDFYVVFLLPVIVLHAIQLNWLNPLISIVVYFVFYLIARFSKEAIGYGDAIIIPVLCLLAGYQTAGLIILMALVLVGVLGLILLVIKKADRKTSVPFVPFLGISYLIYLLF